MGVNFAHFHFFLIKKTKQKKIKTLYKINTFLNLIFLAYTAKLVTQERLKLVPR